MSDEARENANWARVPEADRERCIAALREMIGEDREEWLKAIDHPFFHFSTGMGVRNLLRHVLRDDKLPEVEWTHIDPPIFERNWDDYYMAALREALSDA